MQSDSRIELLIEKYRFWIGGVLILAIVGGSVVLIWRENYAKPTLESRIENLESKIVLMEEFAKRNQEANNDQANLNDQVSGVPTEQAGTVAGINSQDTASQRTDSNKQTVTSQPTSGKININSASATELDLLSGIGPAYAGRIIDYRNTNGGFKSIDEIKNIKGIGEKTFDKFKDQISVN